MAGETTITVIGNLTDDPELRFTSTGQPVANFRIASTPRRRDPESGQWIDEAPLFMTCTAWNQLGEHVAESLTKGARVIATGRLRQRSWDTPDGVRRTAIELVADEVGPSLRFTTATVTATQRRDNTSGQPEPAGTSGEPPF